MTRLFLATRNAHKAQEFREILGADFEVSDLAGHPEIELPPETGATFEENAALKALTVSRYFNQLVIGDDSGLEVDALGGAPGLYSARYAGPEANDRRNVDKLLDELANCCREQRTARFRCVLALAEDGKLVGTFAGTVEGLIIDETRGTNGFGYDPIFVPNGLEQTFAELSEETKNAISHRANAVKVMRELLKTRLPASK